MLLCCCAVQVQLSVWGKPNVPFGTKGSEDGVPVVRWGQTANVGYVPNPTMPKTFMATAVDTGAYEGGCGHDTYPALCIHPGYKAAVGARLALGARNVALGDTTAYFSGPVFDSARAARAQDTNGTTSTSQGALLTSALEVKFRSAGAEGIAVREKDGFEIGVGAEGAEQWTATKVVGSTADSVTLAPAPAGAAAVRYLWSMSPCTHPHGAIGNCSVYSSKEGLPATPFVHRI